MSLRQAFLSVREALDELGATWALVGGLAVGARTEPRFTRDVDLAVAVPDDRTAEALLRDLMRRGYSVVALVEQDAVGRLATARLQAPGTEHLVDLMFASCGVEGEVARNAEPIEIFSGVRAPVARLAHLAAMKILSRDDDTREQDRGDLRRLLKAATPADLEEIRRVLVLMAQRGYHRGRDLTEGLSQALQDLAGP